MTETRKPAAPGDLRARGRRFWRETLAVYTLTDSEMELLREACRLLDECEALREAVAADGVTVTGSTGQTRVHPALGEMRQHRLALGRLLAQLALPDPDGKPLASPESVRGATAARTRWKPPRGVGVRGTA